MSTDQYNNLNSPNNNGSFLVSTPINGQSFTNGSTDQVLSGLTVNVINFGNTRGTLTSYLYSLDSSTHGPSTNLGTIGSISNSSIPNVSTNLNIPLTNTLSLLANTPYYIFLTDTNNNEVGFNFHTASPGEIGTAGTYFEGIGQPGVPQSRDANGYSFGMRVISSDAAVCFTSGTRIRTSRGDVAVEDLRVGDVAVTASGALRPITWIGHRNLTGAGKPLPHDQQPVRVRAGAFGHDASGRFVPARDLHLSPGHPVLVGADADMSGGVLVPVMCLINGISITRQTSATAVTYWHVELEAHDILLAEGLPAESYYDMGSRAWFAGRDGALIDMDFVPAGAHGRCRPVAVDGAVVEAERGRLDGVFAAYLAAQCAWREPAVA